MSNFAGKNRTGIMGLALKSILGSLLGAVPVHLKIIFITSIISILFLIFAVFFPSIIEYLALKPSIILHGGNLWTLATHIFVHGSLLHLFVNMFSLFFIGRIVEQIIGKKRFFWFYLISGIFAGAVSVLLAGFFGNDGVWQNIFGSPDIIMLGASGAIFGLLGILAVLIPSKKVILFTGPLIVIIMQVVAEQFLSGGLGVIVGMLLSIALIFMIAAIILPFGAFTRWAVPIALPLWFAPIVAIIPLIAISFFIALPIGNMAHLAGLIAGLAYAFYLRIKFAKKVMLLEKMFR